MPDDHALTDRLLNLLRERCRARGQTAIDLADLIWSMAERWPDQPRPKLCEVARALAALRRAGHIETRTDANGARTCYLTERIP